MEKSAGDTKIDLSRLFGFAQVERVSRAESDATELHSNVGGVEIEDRKSPQRVSELDQALELHSKVGQP